MDTVIIYETMCTLNANMVETDVLFRNMAGYLDDIRQGMANDETVAILAQGTIFQNNGSWKFRLPAMRDVLHYTGDARLKFVEDESSYNPMDPSYTFWEILGTEMPEIAEQFLEYLNELTGSEKS